MPEIKYSFCRVCEVSCGLKVTVENNKILKMETDRDHIITAGSACSKGLNYEKIQSSPERILHPMNREGQKWSTDTWDNAISDIGTKLRNLIDNEGPDSIAFYMGATAAFNFGSTMMINALMDGVGSKNSYGPGSQGCNNKLQVFQHMYGSPFRMTHPDLQNISLLISFGSNPIVSKMTFTQTANVSKQLRAIEKRGGRIVHVNPRRTETADIVGEQLFIRPDTDIYFVLAFLNELIKTGGVDKDIVHKHMTGFEEATRICEPWTPERAEKVTLVPAEKIRELVAEYIAADGAVLYCGTGISQADNPTIAFWIMEVINAVSGNLDRPGAMIAGKGLFDMAKLMKKGGRLSRPRESRVSGLPAVTDLLPGAVLAEEILTPGKGQIKALINVGGNPVLSIPNPGGRLDEAFQNLELLVCLDIFKNATGSYAHYILPCTTSMERHDLPMCFHWMAGNIPDRYVQYTDRVLEPPEDVRDEGWILTKLALSADVPMFGIRPITWLFKMIDFIEKTPLPGNGFTTDKVIGYTLKMASGAASRKKQLKRYPHGQLLGPNLPGTFLGKNVLTDDGQINLAPELFIKAASTLEEKYKCELDQMDRIKLIGKRDRYSNNSWIHKSVASVGLTDETNDLYVSAGDSARLMIKDGDTVKLSTPSGAIKVKVKVTDELKKGTVALQHGWGDNQGGVNVNLLLPDGKKGCDSLSGMTHMTGIVVDIKKI